MFGDRYKDTTKGQRLVTHRRDAAPSTKLISCRFGLLDSDTKRFTETSNIPYKLGQPYGWIVEVPATDSEIKVVEFLKLPGAGNWITGDRVHVSKQKDLGVVEYFAKPTNGIISSFWSIAPNDPAGSHCFRVYIGNADPITFSFSIQKENAFSSLRRLSIRKP